MANPTFNIQDLVGSVGNKPADPFQYPTPAQQNPQPKRPTRPAPTGPPTSVQAPPTKYAT